MKLQEFITCCAIVLPSVVLLFMAISYRASISSEPDMKIRYQEENYIPPDDFQIILA